MSDVADATRWFNERMDSEVRTEDRGIPHDHVDGYCTRCGGSLCQCEATCAYQGINDAKVGDKESKYRKPCKCEHPIPGNKFK